MGYVVSFEVFGKVTATALGFEKQEGCALYKQEGCALYKQEGCTLYKQGGRALFLPENTGLGKNSELMSE